VRPKPAAFDDTPARLPRPHRLERHRPRLTKVVESTELAIFGCDGVLIDSDQNRFYRAVNAQITELGPAGPPTFHNRPNTDRRCEADLSNRPPSPPRSTPSRERPRSGTSFETSPTSSRGAGSTADGMKWRTQQRSSICSSANTKPLTRPMDAFGRRHDIRRCLPARTDRPPVVFTDYTLVVTNTP